MTSPDSETTIAGKTEAEILAMKDSARFDWYRTISLEDKEEAMKMVETTRRFKISAAWTPERKAKLRVAWTGENNPTKRPEVKAKLSALWTPERKAEQSASMMGENNHNYGKTKTLSDETKAKISAAMTGKCVGENNHFFGKKHTKEVRAKLSAAATGRICSKESRAKQSVSQIEQWKDPKRKAKLSARMTGKDNPMKRPDVIAKHKEAMNQPEHKAKRSAAMIGENNHQFGKDRSEEHRAKISAARIGKYTGENSGNWRGGISFEPYCIKFNDPLKEQYRNAYGRVCVYCGKNELENGERLSVHHVDGNRNQGCDGHEWFLVPLCKSCNSKGFERKPEYVFLFWLKDIERKHRRQQQ
jgi:hypothetical protein